MHISFGSYIKGNSWIHRFDPRLKLFSIICLIVAIFLDTGFIGYFILTGWVLITILISRLPLKVLWKALKPAIFIFIFLFIVNCFLIKPNNAYDIGVIVILQIHGVNIFVISRSSILESLYIGYRIFLMINITTLLTATTKPLDLTLAIEDLLWPLKLMKIPITIVSTIISIAFRMIPTLLQESGRIRKAQASRGVDYKNSHFKEKIKSMISLIVPLLVSSFQKAEDLSYAMDSRGYNAYEKRTRYRVFKIGWIDLLMFLFFISFSVLIYVQYNIHFINILANNYASV